MKMNFSLVSFTLVALFVFGGVNGLITKKPGQCEQPDYYNKTVTDIDKLSGVWYDLLHNFYDENYNVARCVKVDVSRTSLDPTWWVAREIGFEANQFEDKKFLAVWVVKNRALQEPGSWDASQITEEVFEGQDVRRGWSIAENLDRYYVGYGCRYDSKNDLHDASLFVWSRSPSLSNQDRNEINAAIERSGVLSKTTASPVETQFNNCPSLDGYNSVNSYMKPNNNIY